MYEIVQGKSGLTKKKFSFHFAFVEYLIFFKISVEKISTFASLLSTINSFLYMKIFKLVIDV